MPIHHRLPTIIGQAITKYGARTLYADKLVLGKAWTGFKHKSSIVTGIRHGLLAGGVTGSFIRDSDNPEMDAQVPFYGPSASSQDKARNRRGGKRRRFTRNYCPPHSDRRRSRFRKSYSGRNRF